MTGIVFYFVDFGPNGCNKSGASDFITYILDMVAGNLALLSQEYDKQYKEGFKVHMVLNAPLDKPSCI